MSQHTLCCMASLIDPRWWRTAAANPRNWPFDGDKCRRRLHRRHHFSAGSSPVHFVVPRCPPGLSPTWSFLRCSKLHLPSATIASSLSTPLMVVVFGIFVTTSVDTARCRLLFGNVILWRSLRNTPLLCSDAVQVQAFSSFKSSLSSGSRVVHFVPLPDLVAFTRLVHLCVLYEVRLCSL